MADDLVRMLLDELRAARGELRALAERVAKLEASMAGEVSAGEARRSQLVEMGRWLVMAASATIALVALVTK